MKILFLHGWQSTPGGVKPMYLSQHGRTVLNPALPDDDFDAAVRIAQPQCDLGPLNSHKETAMKRSLAMTAFLIAAVLMHADVRGQESSGPPPEMKVLEKLVGTWKVEQTVKVPEESRSTKLVVKREVVLGGRFVQEMGGFDDKGKPTFTGMYTYDSNKKTYRYWLFLPSGFYWEPTGTWDESSQTITFTGRVGAGATGMMTMTLRFSDEATCVLSMITRDAGGETSFHLEGKSVRQR